MELVALGNGLRVALAPCEAESAAFGLFVAAGSRHEPAELAGISHFIEHMLFKGTPTRTPLDISRAIEGRGGMFNAFTGEEATAYFAHLPWEHLDEAVDILARNVADCRELFSAVAEKNDINVSSVRRVAVLSSLDTEMNPEVKERINATISNLEKSGIYTTYVENSVFCAAKAAWNIILCAELCKNTARYDGIRYGHRTTDFRGLEELYTNSRTEGFGELVKAAILYGSEVLSTQNYQKIYEKSLRVRRVIAEEFAKIFEDFDAVLLPACSQMFYTEEQVLKEKYIAFEENRYTAPATLAGLPAVVAGGVQLIGKPNAEEALLDVAKFLAGEGK